MVEATGYQLLDEAPAKKVLADKITIITNPLDAANSIARNSMFVLPNKDEVDLDRIDRGYKVEGYLREAIDKFVELIIKHGYDFDCETEEPRAYIKRRLRLMGLMTNKPFELTINDLVMDVVKYARGGLVKVRGQVVGSIKDIPAKGAGEEKNPVLAYFRFDPKRMKKKYSDKTKAHIGWDYSLKNGKTKYFQNKDVIFLNYNVQAGEDHGSPIWEPTLDDISAYRQAEEIIFKLLQKHTTPLMHHKVPAIGDTGLSRQEDVDAAAANHMVMAPDGFIITGQGHEISMIGAESRAIRAEGYMDMFRSRIFAGTGMNRIVMGESDAVSEGGADAMTTTMHNKAKHIQFQLACQLNSQILNELLLEGGYDPSNENDVVTWYWHDIETESRLAKENHLIQLWTNNAITENDLRASLRKKPMSDEEWENTYVNRVKIPEAIEAAKAKAQFSPTSGPANQVGNKANPANQHGKRGAPKVRPK